MDELAERGRVRTQPRSRDRGTVKIEGYRIIDIPHDRNPESIGRPREDRPQVFFEDQVYQEMRKYLAGDLVHERGGVLLGYRNRIPQGQTYSEVTGFFPATTGRSSPIEFQFTNDDFVATLREVDKRAKGEQIIAWVHSHPHHNPAPSEHSDFFIMKHFMQDFPENFTLIVNPNTNQVGLFRWEEGKAANQGGFILYGDLPRGDSLFHPRVVRANSLDEPEPSRIKVHPETWRQRLTGIFRRLIGKGL